jgi:hypothetical protein
MNLNTITPKGVFLLGNFPTCNINSGEITLNIPETTNLKLVAMYIDYSNNSHAGTIITPSKIQSIDKNHGLFTIKLDKTMEGINPTGFFSPKNSRQNSLLLLLILLIILNKIK